MQQSMLSATDLSSKRVAPVFGSRGAARKTFGGSKFVVKATQQRHQNERRQGEQRGRAQATFPMRSVVDQPC